MDSMQASHIEEVQRLQATIAALRSEVVALKKEMANDAVKLNFHSGVLAARDVAISDTAREVENLKQQLDAKREDNLRLQRQLSHLVEEVRQSQHDATTAQMERERLLGPLTAQADALGQSLVAKQQQVDLLQQDLDAANQQNASLQADLASMRQVVEQVNGERLREQQVAEHHLQELRAELEAQAKGYQRRQRLLHARCRLLQAWCFRAWWCLEAELDPVQPEAEAVAHDPGHEGRREDTAVRGSSTAVDILPRKRLPLPADWRAVLRFQATLFHWLAAEVIRGKTLESRGQPLSEEQVTVATVVSSAGSAAEAGPHWPP